MSLRQKSSQRRRAAVQEVSRDVFYRALDALNVDEVRRCLKVDRSLVHGYPEDPPLVHVVSNHNFTDSGRSVLELVELVRVLLDHKARINSLGWDGFGETALHYAVDYNLVELVELLLRYKARVHSSLFIAKSAEVARLLIAHGADDNRKDVYGRTALFNAQNVEVARFLISHGADVNSKDFLGRTPLFDATNVEVAQLLIAYGAEVKHRGAYGVTPLFHAKNVEVAQLLIGSGADVNSKDDLGRTPLLDLKHVEVAQLLMAHGADVNSKDNRGRTPLLNAKNVEMARLLIANGADVNSNDSLDRTPCVVFANNVEVARLLEIAHGEDVNCRDEYGYPVWLSVMQWCEDLEELKVHVDQGAHLQGVYGVLALHWAVLHGKLEIMELLLDQGVPVNAKVTADGETPLHIAVRGVWVQGIQLLLQRGADANATDRHGKTPFAHVASSLLNVLRQPRRYHGSPWSVEYKSNAESTMRLLLDAGAPVDERSKNGATALLAGVRIGWFGCATLLLNRGADIHAANQKGCTPFLEACKQARLDMIYCLIRSSSHHARLGLQPRVSRKKTGIRKLRFEVHR